MLAPEPSGCDSKESGCAPLSFELRGDCDEVAQPSSAERMGLGPGKDPPCFAHPGW